MRQSASSIRGWWGVGRPGGLRGRVVPGIARDLAMGCCAWCSYNTPQIERYWPVEVCPCVRPGSLVVPGYPLCALALHDRKADIHHRLRHGLSLRAVGNEACRRLAHARAVDAHGREAGDHGLGELDVSETDDGQLVGDRHDARPRLGVGGG